MTPLKLVLLASVAAGVLSLLLFRLLPPESQTSVIEEFAKVLFQFGLLGALAAAGKVLLQQWDTEKAQRALRQELIYESLKTLHRRFEVALSSFSSKQASPDAWRSFLFEGSSSNPETSMNVVLRIRAANSRWSSYQEMRSLLDSLKNDEDRMSIEPSLQKGISLLFRLFVISCG